MPVSDAWRFSEVLPNISLSVRQISASETGFTQYFTQRTADLRIRDWFYPIFHSAYGRSPHQRLKYKHRYDEFSFPDCYSYKDADSCHKDYNETGLYYNQTCYNETMAVTYGIRELVGNMTKRPPAEEYFE
jgi:hypothetical protein